MDTQNSHRINKSILTVSSLLDLSDDKDFWLSKTPSERLQFVEILRQLNYGQTISTARLQRILTIAERTSS
ncbi:hypothetical protein EBS67_02490 [bacterium]|nr:hypothetical protein [bacterium]NBT60366.1 hypothetical protein [Planctomycetia bacterium]